jgi:hypothetical protein
MAKPFDWKKLSNTAFVVALFMLDTRAAVEMEELESGGDIVSF